MQGNCSDPDIFTDFNLEPEESNGLLPLKPFQCMLIIDETWLFVNGGAIWVDNLYLRVIRRHKRLPSVAFITAGKSMDVHVTMLGRRPSHVTNTVSTRGISRSDIFATNITFQGDPHGTSATAVTTSIKQVSIYIDGVALAPCLL